MGALRAQQTPLSGAAWASCAVLLGACSSPPEPASVFDLARPRLLALETYDGSGQVVHPDVVRWPARGGELWMAITPYPGAREKWENPCLYRSRDGISWAEPFPRLNPVVPRPRFDHNCDPDLAVAADGLHLFYLETQRREYRPDDRHFQELRVVRSPDGRHWSEPETLFHWNLDTDPLYLSPCVAAAPEGFRLFLVWPKGRIVHWRASADLRSFGEPSGTLETGIPGLRPWHLDVFPAEGGWVALLCARGPDAEDNLDVDLWIGASPDLERWAFRPEPLLAATDRSLGVEIVYRSTGLVRNDRLAIWYSGRTRADTWVLGATAFDVAIVRELLARAGGSPPAARSAG